MAEIENERKWDWALGYEAEDFAIGVISPKGMRDYNKLEYSKEWPLFSNTFRFVPVHRNFSESVENGCMNQPDIDTIHYIQFDGGNINQPARRFVAMLVAFGIAKRSASNEQQYDIEEQKFGTDTEEMILACWFAGTNWFLTVNLFDIWQASQALEQGIESTIKVYMGVEDFNNPLLNSSRLFKAWEKEVEYHGVDAVCGYFLLMMYKDNSDIEYGEKLLPYAVDGPKYDLGVINHRIFRVYTNN